MGDLMGAGGQAAIKEKQGQKGKLLRKKSKEELQFGDCWDEDALFGVCKRHLASPRANRHHRESAGETFHVGGKYKDTQ